jgi:hypothetical protein
MTARLFLALTVLLLLTQPATAQNLLANPGFDSSLSGWEATAWASWDGTRDADGSASSGSAKGIADFQTVGGDAVVVSQCIPLAHTGDLYVFGGKIFLPGSQAGSSSAFFSLGFFADSACHGAPVPGPGGLTPLVTTLNHWTEASATVYTVGAAAKIWAVLRAQSTGTLEGSFDDLFFQPATAATCIPDANTLCLGASRFKVAATFDAGGGNAGNARAVPLTADTGYLWFFNATNVESIVKVIDGCGLGGHFWVFAGGLTNVKVVLTVTDLHTGAVKTYTNPPGRAFVPIQDTSAFACP